MCRSHIGVINRSRIDALRERVTLFVDFFNVRVGSIEQIEQLAPLVTLQEVTAL